MEVLRDRRTFLRSLARSVWLVIPIGAVSIASSAYAQVVAGESEVKAAFVQNFTRFIEWPADSFRTPNAPFVVAIVGDDPMGIVLDETVRGKSANGHPIEVRHLRWDQDLRGSQIVFISASEERHLTAILGNLDKGGVLTVSDIDRFSFSGGMIELRMVGNHLRFDIDWNRTRAARLSVSAKLLNVARAVRDGNKNARP